MNNGGPAFPAPVCNAPIMSSGSVSGGLPYMAQSGMSLRDWFAGQALASIAERDDWFPNVIAARAYAVADAMLVERTKETGA